jgi:RHS repeat-associated protein
MKRISITLLVYFVLLSGVAILGAATRPKFQPSGSVDGDIARYVVTLAEDTVGDDLGALKRELALTYGARLEANTTSDLQQFVVIMLPARARLLSADHRVSEVAEVSLTTTAASPETPAVGLPSAPSPPRFTTQPSGFGDNGQSGTYTYDGAGNITAIGADTYRYDTAQRLVSSVTRGAQEDYSYDAFGNRKSATGAINCLGQPTCAQTVTVDSNTNHLTTINGAAVTYDDAGNIKTIDATSGNPGAIYTYDGTGMMTEATVGSDDRQLLYTADDERIAVKHGASWIWTVRDPSGKVLREFTSLETGPNLAMTNWQWAKDYIWRDGLLLATTTPTGTLHYHLDHLGTPRLVTGANGVEVAEHAYYPFGAEINLTPHETPEELMKFTGHERDIVAGDGHTLDYMHARYDNASLGRFVSVDPVINRKRSMAHPQAWNRYAYVENNPMNMTDPDGRNAQVTCQTTQNAQGLSTTNCTATVMAQIVVHTRAERATAQQFANNARSYWNNQTARGPNGEVIKFNVQLNVVNPNQQVAGRDTLSVVSGAGRTQVQMTLDFGTNRTLRPDTGNIYTRDTTGNPSGMSGIAPHETGHLMGLRDLYPPAGVPAFVDGPQHSIMEMAQPHNNADYGWWVLSPYNGNATVTYVP